MTQFVGELLASVRVNIDPIKDTTGRIVGAVNVFHDVTELIRAEQSLREAERLKDEFWATLAHELRNPLAPIRSGLEVMAVARMIPLPRKRFDAPWCGRRSN